jgi:hypothetical protein
MVFLIVIMSFSWAFAPFCPFIKGLRHIDNHRNADGSVRIATSQQAPPDTMTGLCASAHNAP